MLGWEHLELFKYLQNNFILTKSESKMILVQWSLKYCRRSFDMFWFVLYNLKAYNMQGCTLHSMLSCNVIRETRSYIVQCMHICTNCTGCTVHIRLNRSTPTNLIDLYNQSMISLYIQCLQFFEYWLVLSSLYD